MADSSSNTTNNTNHNHGNGVLSPKDGNKNVVKNAFTISTISNQTLDHQNHHDHSAFQMVETGHFNVGLTSQSSQVDLVTQDATARDTDPDQVSVDQDAMTFCCLETTTFKMFVCFFAGFMFGLAMEKGRVYEPRAIRAQFIYERFIMLKMFLAAVGFGALCLALLSVLPFTKDAFERAFRAYTSCLPRKGVLGVLIGGSLLGAGMVVAGACPGMVLVQVGSWVGGGSCLMTLFGCLVAAFAYGLVDPYIAKLFVPKKPYEKQAAMQFVNVPFSVLAIAMATVTAVIVFILEWFFPWQTELYVPNSPVSWFMQLLAWPPYVAGIIIGAMQIPIVLAVGDTLGGSSGYCTVVSQFLFTKSMETKVPYLAGYKRGIANWWQVFYVCGAILGGCMSAFASRSLGSVPGVSLQSSFIGGFLMVFGARMAGGCTSGHGLSGVGLLMMLSMLAAGAMFASGTVVGFICLALDKANLIDYYTF